MAAMTLEQILDRVQELKQENQEKDDVIRDQQIQIDELERKLREAEELHLETSMKLEELNGVASKADELLEKLSDALG